MNPRIKAAFAAVLPLFFVACSQSGDKSSEENSGNQESVTSVRLYGTANTEATRDDPIQLVAYSYDKNDTLVDSLTKTLIHSNNSNQAQFDLTLKTTDDGGTVVVTTSQEGYTSFSRSITLSSATDIELQVRMQPTTQATITPSSSTSNLRSGLRRDSFTIRVMEDARGARFIESGNGLRSTRAANASDVLVIDIPVSSVPAGTSSLNASVANFDPNSPDDAEVFPGEYADSDGYELVSVAFDFAEITLPSGENIGRSAQRLALRNTSEPTIIERFIPEDSCSAVAALGDIDSNTTGVQIPVYTYNPNSGLWDRLGEGTLYDDNGVIVAVSQSDCETFGYYLAIEVTNAEFLRKWWNLDYPLIFDEPVELCATIQLQNQDGNAVAGSYVWMSDDDGRSFSDSYAYSDANGQVQIKATLIDGSDDRTAIVRYYDFASGDFTQANVTLAESCGSPTVVTLTRPDTCEFQGTVRDANGTLEGVDIFAFGLTDAFLYHDAFTVSDSAGNYVLDAFCNTDYTIYSINGLSYEFLNGNVNSEVADDESTDNGAVATLNPMEVINNPPFGSIWFEDFNVWTDETQLLEGLERPVFNLAGNSNYGLYGYVVDFEGNYPIDVSINLKRLNGTVIDTVTFSLDNDGTFIGADDLVVTLQSTASGSYYLTGTMTDSSGNSSSLYEEFAYD